MPFSMPAWSKTLMLRWVRTAELPGLGKTGSGQACLMHIALFCLHLVSLGQALSMNRMSLASSVSRLLATLHTPIDSVSNSVVPAS